MNGFLVLWVHSMDDIPVRLFATEAEARSFCETNPLPDDSPLVNPAAIAEEVDVWGMDAATPVGYKIAEFCDGKLVRWDECGVVDS